jgi:KDO2-lipid IV(A) lauroyltransferase
MLNFLVYLIVLVPYTIICHLPYKAVKGLAFLSGSIMDLIPSIRKLVRANIHAAMPELPPQEVARICRQSLKNLVWNLLEFIWVDGDIKRINRCYYMRQDTIELHRKAKAEGKRFIYVNPHLGSWEASGTAGAFFTGMTMAVIAKPVTNPYLNKLLNTEKREKLGLKVLFTKGAVRGAVKALRDGMCLGTLVDQNTKVRYGGIFVNFFGIPVPSSPAPMEIKSYCDKHDIPVELLFGVSLRREDGRLESFCEPLSKPFDQYTSQAEVLQEFLDISERYIRQYPEQYLWLYRRFQHIPRGASPEIRARFPYYAKDASDGFYDLLVHRGKKK